MRFASNHRSFASAVIRAWRSLKRRPGFLAIAVTSLAVALGLATAVIAQIDSLLHPYAPVKDASRLYALTLSGIGRDHRQPPVEDVFAVLRSSPVVESAVAAGLSIGPLEAGGFGSLSGVSVVPTEYFTLLGTQPKLGRIFASGETPESGVAIVTNEFWRRYFHDRASLDSATVTFNNKPYQIVGVIGGAFGGEGGFFSGVSLPAGGATIQNPMYYVRVRPHVSEQNLNSAVQAAAKQLVDRFGAGNRQFSFSTKSMKPDPLQLRDFHRAMIGAAVFVLLIACANISALMLARSVAGRRDQALRLALGAGRADLIRDVLAEIALVTAIGGAAGLVIGFWAMRIMAQATPVELQWLGFIPPHLSTRVFGALLLVVMATIAMASLIPAWFASGIQPAEPLKEGSGSTTGRPARRFEVLIVGELALSMILLLGAALVTKSAGKVHDFDFGYNARPVWQVEIGAIVIDENTDTTRLRLGRMPHISKNDLDAMAAALRARPDVQDAAWISEGSGYSVNIMVSDATAAADSNLYLPQTLAIGPGLLRTLGLPVIAGRDFVDADRESGAVMLDQRGARRLFPQGNAVGGMVRMGPPEARGPWIRVVGIVANAIHELPTFPEAEPRPVVYIAANPSRSSRSKVVVRPKSGTEDVLPVTLSTLRAMVPSGVALKGEKWISRYDAMLAARRFVAGIFITLSVASLLLATAGLFGVLSYAVSQRMREFAVRVALGADKPNIVRLVTRDGLVLALSGTAAGGLGGLVAGFSVYQWLWGVYPVDAPSLVIAECVLLTVTMAATAVPAVRAAAANPVDVLRAM